MNEYCRHFSILESPPLFQRALMLRSLWICGFLHHLKTIAMCVVVRVVPYSTKLLHNDNIISMAAISTNYLLIIGIYRSHFHKHFES